MSNMFSGLTEIKNTLLGVCPIFVCQKDLPDHNCLSPVSTRGTEGPESLPCIRLHSLQDPLELPPLFISGVPVNSDLDMKPPITSSGSLETVLTCAYTQAVGGTHPE